MDIQTMIQAVSKEKARLEIELQEATVREIPAQMETLAKTFNEDLDQAIKEMARLETVFNSLREKESEFYKLQNTRSAALSRLGRHEPLELKESLGKMALAPSPHRFVFSTSTQLPYFVANLQNYREKITNYEKFLASNPKHAEKVRSAQDTLAKPFRIGNFMNVFR